MKSITGKITSTKSISLSKASKVLSNFINAETGASQAVSSYLRRASASFDELVQLHKELKASKPDRKIKQESTFSEETVKHEQENEVSQKKKRKSEEIVDSAGQSSLKKKKKRRRNEDED